MNKASIPTTLTWLRVAAIPVAFALWTLEVPQFHAWVLGIFVFAALTDFLDGYLARRWNVTSSFGAMLDQISDKLLTTAYLIMLVYGYGIPVLFAVILILRDVFISGLREHLALKGATLPVSKGGKWKTALIMLAIALTLLGIVLGNLYVVLAGHALLAVACILAIVSAVQYVRASRASL